MLNYQNYLSPVMQEWTVGRNSKGMWYDSNPIGSRYMINPQSGRYSIHTGADLNLSGNADKNQPTYSIYKGEVIFAQRVKESTWGNLIVIDHGDFCSRYGHLARIDVRKGDVVYSGQQIGLVGNTGMEWGETHHLHFDICKTDALNKNPTYWPGDNRKAVFDNFVDPHEFLFSGSKPENPYEEPLPLQLVVVANVLNVRSGPSIRHQIVRQVKYGDTLYIKADWYNTTSDFVQVDRLGKEFVSKRWVKLVGTPLRTDLGYNIDGRGDAEKVLIQVRKNATIRLPLARVQKGESYYAELASLLKRQRTREVVWVLNHQFFGEGAGYNWELMTSDLWDGFIDQFSKHLLIFLKQYPVFNDETFVFQIWNEQDHASPAAVYMPPDKFGKLINLVSNVLVSLGAKNKMITGGFVMPTLEYMTIVRKTLTPNAYARLHAVAVHPYGAEGEQFGFKIKLNQVKNLFEQVWGNDKPIWITEVGLCGGGAVALSRNVVRAYVMRVRKEAVRLKYGRLLWYAYEVGQDNCTGLVSGNDISVLEAFLDVTSLDDG